MVSRYSIWVNAGSWQPSYLTSYPAARRLTESKSVRSSLELVYLPKVFFVARDYASHS